jgi:hypothetical protein
MHWSTLDWSATALLVLTAPFAALLTAAAAREGAARRVVVDAWDRVGPAEMALGLFLYAVLFIQVVALHEGGWFGQSMAAWVQAFGSIAAIGAAIWVDQGAARRSRHDRKSATLDATANRLGAVRDCHARVSHLLALLRSWAAEPRENWRPKAIVLRDVKASHDAVLYFLPASAMIAPTQAFIFATETALPICLIWSVLVPANS